MEIKNKTYKVVTPKEGMWLYNENEKTSATRRTSCSSTHWFVSL